MNEIIFLIHILLVVGFGMGALKKGREALMIWVVLQAILANLFVIKQISFLSFEVTCSDVFAVGSLLGLNLLQEYFGKEAAKRATGLCLYCMLFFAAMSSIHLRYHPSIHDTTQSAFSLILSHSPRLFLASLVSFFLTQQIDRRLFKKLKEKLHSFSPSNLISLLTSQFLDTLFFSFLGLYGLVASLSDILLVSFLIKVFIILCMTPLTALCRKHVNI